MVMFAGWPDPALEIDSELAERRRPKSNGGRFELQL